MPKFKVLAGVHIEEDTIYNKGEIFHSDKPLDEVFVNKFERVTSSGKKKSKKDSEDEEEDDDSMGKDVTREYKTAEKYRLRVFKTGGGKYNVTTAGDTETALNEKPLSKIRVSKFLRDQGKKLKKEEEKETAEE